MSRGSVVHQRASRLLLSVNELLGIVTGTTWLPWAVWWREWQDHHPRSATCISELKAESMGDLAAVGVTGDRRRVDLTSAGEPRCRAGVGQT
jgi:hypothetical protein